MTLVTRSDDDADDAARQPSASVSGGLAVVLSSQTEVVLAGVDDDGAAQDVGVSVERDHAVLDVDVGGFVRDSHDVAQISDVPFLSGRRTVLHIERVEVAFGSLTAVGRAASCVYVKTVFTGDQARNAAGHQDGVISTLQHDCPGDAAVVGGSLEHTLGLLRYHGWLVRVLSGYDEAAEKPSSEQRHHHRHDHPDVKHASFLPVFLDCTPTYRLPVDPEVL